MLRVILPFSILSVVIGTSCAKKECTSIGCGASIEVHFTGASDTPGRYQVEVVADGVKSNCQFTLPQDCNLQPSCTPSAAGWLLSKSPCSPGEARRRFDGFTFQAAPKRLDVVVRRDDAVVSSGGTEPVYTESHPNGLECEPVCRRAEIFVDIAH